MVPLPLAVLHLLVLSWRDIDFKWEGLTKAEKSAISRDDFESVVAALRSEGLVEAAPAPAPKVKEVPSEEAKASWPVGAAVKVMKLSDSAGDRNLVGRVGRIESYIMDCGATPDEPMIHVVFHDGSGAADGFWPEELEVVRV